MFQTRQASHSNPENEGTIVQITDNGGAQVAPPEKIERKESTPIEIHPRDKELKISSRHPEVSKSQMKGNYLATFSF